MEAASNFCGSTSTSSITSGLKRQSLLQKVPTSWSTPPPAAGSMEAGSFLSSNPYTKATEILPLITRNHLFPGRNSSSHQTRRSPVVACCGSGVPPSEDEDGSGPSILRSDWRAFRARLAARERSEEFYAGAQLRDPISLGDKWAHAIHQPEKGCLLIATEKLDGVHIFERTVILLLSAGEIYHTGVILNRPSLMSIKETRSSAMDESGLFSNRPLFFGGPVEEGIFLITPGSGNSGSRIFDEVMKGVYFGTKESVGGAANLVKSDMFQTEDFRFFDGCCVWEKQQLAEEIRAGYWALAACSPSLIKAPNLGIVGLWEEISGLLGPRRVW